VVRVVAKTDGLADFDKTVPSARFKTLPEHIPLKDTIATQDPDAPPDPTMGRDTDRDFMLRNAGG
jgi:hypothetical protein